MVVSDWVGLYSLAKVNDRLAVWSQTEATPSADGWDACKSERPLSGLESINLLKLLLLVLYLQK